jgi:hypothetical protein
MKSPSQHTSQTVNQPSTWWTLCCWVGTGATHWGRKTRHADWRSRLTRTWSEDAGIRGILLMLLPYFSSTSECQISPEDELIVTYLLYHNDDIYGQVIFIKVINYQGDVIIYTWSSSLHCWWSELASSIITFRIQPHNKCFIWAEVIYAHCGPSVMSHRDRHVIQLSSSMGQNWIVAYPSARQNDFVTMPSMTMTAFTSTSTTSASRGNHQHWLLTNFYFNHSMSTPTHATTARDNGSSASTFNLLSNLIVYIAHVVTMKDVRVYLTC